MYRTVNPCRRARLHCAIALALLTPATLVNATDLGPGRRDVVNPGDPVQAWNVFSGSTLTFNAGAAALNVALTTSTLVATDTTFHSTNNDASDIAVRIANGSVATLNGGSIRSDYGIGLAVVGTGGIEGADRASRADVNGTSISGARYGVSVGNGNTLVTSAAAIEANATNGSGAVVTSGTAQFTAGTTVTGVVNGATLLGDSRFGDVPSPGRILIVDDSTVQGVTGAAVHVQRLRPVDLDARIDVVNGGKLFGGNGTAIDIDSGMQVEVNVANSTIDGDITALKETNGVATAQIALGDNAMLRGVMDGQGIDAHVGGTASWLATGTSRIHDLQLDGTLAVASDGDYKAINLGGDLTGLGGKLVLNTNFNEGGVPGKQFTDRLLVHGNVTTSGTTLVTVAAKPASDGALTDMNHNGVVDPSEGISIIQVGGTSRADAFALAGGYVAAGPWQYTLHAFGPGEADQAQSQLGAGAPLQWDYRLGNRYVEDCGDKCHPVDPVTPVDPVDPVDPVNPVDPVDPIVPGDPAPIDRAAVVPQLPAYMLAPMALQNYGNIMNDGLHQRLAEIRDSAYGANVGGEVFARVLSSQLNYTRNLSFQRYGYDFDQQINALQVGAGIVAVDSDEGSIRAGWALDHGTSRVTPSAADGNSHSKYYANGGAAWGTYQHNSGLWVDGVLGITRYHGDISTDLRGDEVGKLHAQGWTMSVEVGKPLPMGGDWTVEPQFQFRIQQLNFQDFRDKDGLDIRLGNSVQATSRLGVQVGRTANPVFAPYGRLDFIHVSNGNPTLQASSEAWNTGDTFQTGNTGNMYRVAAGLTSQLTDHIQLYGEGTWRHYLGGYGLKGWSANAGLRITF